MAGVGVKLHRIYGKNSIVSKIAGFVYSTVLSIAPMLLIMISLMVMGKVLGISKIGYAQRELFSCTVLYIFIFHCLQKHHLMQCFQDICLMLYTMKNLKM